MSPRCSGSLRPPGTAVHGPGLRLRLPARRAAVDGGVRPGAGEGSRSPHPRWGTVVVTCVCLPAHFGDVFWPQGEAHLYFSPLAAWRQHPVPLFQHPTSLRHQPGSPIIIVIILAATPASSAPRRRIPAGDIPPPPVPNRAGIKIFSGSYVCVGDTGWGGGAPPGVGQQGWGKPGVAQTRGAPT